MSKAKMPPVPPANRSPQGHDQGSAATHQEPAKTKSHMAERDVNVEQQGQTANTIQNTNHQGRQQDR